MQRPTPLLADARLRSLEVATATALAFGATVVSAGEAAAQESGESSRRTSDPSQNEALVVAQNDPDDEEASDQDEDETETSKQTSGSQLQRSDRMEFDARLIRGERASGAVFLFQRAPRKLPSMVERRRTYLRESVHTVLGSEWAESFTEERSKAVQSGGVSSENEGDESSSDSSDDERSIIQEFSTEQD